MRTNAMQERQKSDTPVTWYEMYYVRSETDDSGLAILLKSRADPGGGGKGAMPPPSQDAEVAFWSTAIF